MSGNVLSFPTTRKRPYPQGEWYEEEDLAENVHVLKNPRPVAPKVRGHGQGRRELGASTHRETKLWRALAKEVNAARDNLNRVLPAEGWERGRTVDDHLAFDEATVRAAHLAYKVACSKLLQYPAPKPRHLVTMFRAGLEVLDMPDPVWCDARSNDCAPLPDRVMYAFLWALRRTTGDWY